MSVALHRRWGDDGLGVLQLLRCWLAAIGRQAQRPLAVGDPACAMLLPDEAAMLAAIRRPDRTAEALRNLCRESQDLVPLAAVLSRLLGRSAITP